MALSKAATYKQSKRLVPPPYKAPSGFTGTGAGAYNAPPPGSPTGPQTIEHEGIGGSWQHPDYAALIQGDPTLMGGRGDINAARNSYGLSLAAAIKQAVTRFGLAPTNWNPKSGIANPIDETTLQAARDNPLSQVHQMQEARGRSREDLASALAGRGLIGGTGLESGAVSAGEQRIQQDYERNEGMGTQNLLDALSGYEGQYTENVNNLAREQRQMESDAAARIMGTYGPTWKFDTDPWTETIPAPGNTPATWDQIIFGGAGKQATPDEYEAALREWIKQGAEGPGSYGWQNVPWSQK